MADDDLMAAALATQEEEKKNSKEVEEKSTEEPTEPQAPSQEEPAEEAPSEPEADTSEEVPAKDADRMTRKERREERKNRFEFLKRQQGEPEEATPYRPLDITQAPEDGFEPDELVADRERYAETKAKQAAKVTEVNAFWKSVGDQHELLTANPKYKFLDKESDSFDEDKADTINSLYLKMVGHNPQTNFVRDTNIPYKDFVKNFVATMEDWAGEREAETVKNVASQKSRSGVRPTGTARKQASVSQPKDLQNLSKEEFEKVAPEIMEQAIAQLGQ